MESIEVMKLYNRNIKRSHSFLLNVLGYMYLQDLVFGWIYYAAFLATTKELLIYASHFFQDIADSTN